jgi:hypothetical protein
MGVETSESVVAGQGPTYASHARKFGTFRTCLRTHLLLRGQVRRGEQNVDGLLKEGPCNRRVVGDSTKNRRRNLLTFCELKWLTKNVVQIKLTLRNAAAFSLTCPNQRTTIFDPSMLLISLYSKRERFARIRFYHKPSYHQQLQHMRGI